MIDRLYTPRRARQNEVVRSALGLLLAIHGLIHLLGFLSAFKLARVPALTARTLFALPGVWARIMGLAWFFTCVILLGAALLLVLGEEFWWWVGGVGILLSQVLVIYAWPDAKAGTFANGLLLVLVLVGWGDTAFRSDWNSRAEALLTRASSVEPRFVTREVLEPLPISVRRWLERSHGQGARIPTSVRLRQRGRMRISPDGAELSATAEQVFRVDAPEFIWCVRAWMLNIIPFSGLDTYVDGRGRMLIRLASLIPVVDAANAKIDEGALIRFLAETVWFPGAALMPYVRWEGVDTVSAKATMTYRGVSGSAVFHFDDQGRFVRLIADRYLGGGRDAKREKWEVIADDWSVMDGSQVPVRGQVRWKLAAGDFTFYRWELLSLEYDPQSPFESRAQP